ncbi:MAG: hypothetical protein KatS3mg105_4570 [Gemmatales bacterium]|nr:MAG: hypothetical protein KatS3mg105_4570 [Gemmatales bacterium]
MKRNLRIIAFLSVVLVAPTNVGAGEPGPNGELFLFTGSTLPASGLGDNFFTTGLGANVGKRFLLKEKATCDCGWLGFFGELGFNYNHWLSQRNQATTPFGNFLIEDANSYLGEFGFGLAKASPLNENGTGWIAGVSVVSQVGAFLANVDGQPFNIGRPTTVMFGIPRENGFALGYRAKAWAGVRLPRGGEVGIEGGGRSFLDRCYPGRVP